MVCRDASGPGKAFRSVRAAKGFSLVEALVAVLVLAVAVLGTAAGFAQALRGSRSALLRSGAVQLSSDLAERLRAQPDDLAASELQWRTRVQDLLPQAGKLALLANTSAARVTHAAVAADTPRGIQLELRWIDPADADIASLQALIELPAASTP